MDTYDRVKELCKSRKITIKRLEEDLGIARGNACKWRTFTPSASVVAKLSDYFGVSPAYILYGHSDNVTDVKETLDGIILSLKVSNDLKFNGGELDAVAKQLLINGLENILDVTNKYLIK